MRGSCGEMAAVERDSGIRDIVRETGPICSQNQPSLPASVAGRPYLPEILRDPTVPFISVGR